VTRLAALLIALLTLLVAAAPAAAQHVVATANGATARSSANQGEILTCDAAGGCSSAITAPARPPATWDGELPVSRGTVIEVAFGRPVDLLAAHVVDRQFAAVGDATVERIDGSRYRVTVGASPPERAALRLLERWEGDDERGHHTVHRTDYVGLVAPASLLGVTQPRRGGGVVADLDARASGLVDARLHFGSRTLGQRSTNLAGPRRGTMSVPLSRGARRLLADRRRLKATLTLTYRPPSGDALTVERRVTLRAKPR